MIFWHRRYRYLSALVMSSAVFFSSPSIAQQTPTSPKTFGPVAVGIQLLTDKNAYKIGDDIVLRVLLTNKTKKAIFVGTRIDWGFSASIEIWAKDVVSGKLLSPGFLHDAIDPPPGSKDDFVRLEPDHIYGAVLRSSLNDLGIRTAGKYNLFATYHSRVDRAEFRFGLPSWAGENYQLEVAPTEIAVTP